MFFKKQKNVIKLTQRGELMKYDSQGFIQISAYTAAGALPVSNVTVRISGNEEGNIGIEYSMITDRNGLTEVVALPTPAKSYSLSPGASEQPYAKYDVQASADGFYEKNIYDVAVFSGIKSILPLEMIPNAGFTRNVSPPMSSNSSIISENEDLQ